MLDEVERFVADVDSRQGAAFHHAMSTFELQIERGRFLQLDPHGIEYRQLVESQYERIHGAAYRVAAEAATAAFDIDDPEPYSSRNAHYVGAHLGAIATVLRDFPLQPPARILDIGMGWGNTSLALARTGFTVDAVDINADFTALVDHWARRLGVAQRLTTHCLPFSELRSLARDGGHDGILFFESFHHALEHQQLLGDCATLLNDAGAIVFAGEPIYHPWPVPWMLRNDGLSVYCIHKHGWMELGFEESYFLEVLLRAGLWAERRTYIDHPVADGFVARKLRGAIPIARVVLPQRYEESWNPGDSATSNIRWTTADSALPRQLLRGRSLQFNMGNHKATPTRVTIHVGSSVAASHRFEPGEERSLYIDPAPGQAGEDGDIRIVADVVPNASGVGDMRMLGIAVTTIEVLS